MRSHIFVRLYENDAAELTPDKKSLCKMTEMRQQIRCQAVGRALCDAALIPHITTI